MSNAEGLARAAAELALVLPGRMASDAARGDGFLRDYGQGRRTPNLGATRLSGGGSWHSDGDGGPDRKDGVDYGDRRPRQTLWRQMMMALCPGTRVFVVCLAVATFIAVV